MVSIIYGFQYGIKIFSFLFLYVYKKSDYLSDKSTKTVSNSAKNTLKQYQSSFPVGILIVSFEQVLVEK